MQDRLMLANLMKQTGNGLVGFAVLFTPVLIHLNNPTNRAMTLWTLAYVTLVLAYGALGLLIRGLADTELARLTRLGGPESEGKRST